MDVLRALDLRIDEIFNTVRLYLGGRFVTALEIMKPSLKLHRHKGVSLGLISSATLEKA